MKKAGKLNVFKQCPSQSDSEVTIDYCLQKLVISGNPEEVSEQILALREKVGSFGTLLNVGVDCENSVLAKRSLELLKRDVQPLVVNS